MYLRVTTLAKITDHTGRYLLPQALPETNFQSRPLDDISQSTLKWPEIHCPTKTCWKLWSTTTRKLFTGSTAGNRLQEKLGAWTESYQQARFWKWRYSNCHRILHQQNPLARPKVALITQTARTYWQILATIPTNLPFDGPPITPHDAHKRRMNLPITPLPASPNKPITLAPHHSLTDQLRLTIPPWQ